MPEWETLPRNKIVQRFVVKKLWVAGRASEDREQWSKEVKGPLRKMLRRRRRDTRGAGGEDSVPTTERRQSGCMAGEESRNHCRESPCTTWEKL